MAGISTGGMDAASQKLAARLQDAMRNAVTVAGNARWGQKNVDDFGKRLKSAYKALEQANLRGDKNRADILQKRLEGMSMELVKPKDMRSLTEGLSKATESFGDGLHKAFEAVKSKDLKSVAGLMKSLGKSASGAGAKMETTSMKGGMGEMVATLGKAVSGIGTFVAVVGGMAVAIAAVIKLVLDADSRIKDFNKSLLDAGIAGQEFGYDIGRSMDRMQDAFLKSGATDYLNSLGIKAKDAVATMGGFQKAGMTFHKLGGDIGTSAEATEKLREAVKSAVVYSKLLGESADKVAGDMAKMAEETSTTLEGVRSKFSDIAAASKQAGFDTKRFYGMVLEATSGMAMYNVRLQDTIGLLSNAAKVLGPDAGKAWAQSLAGTGKDMSTKDAYIAQKKMGTQQVQKASKIDAKMQAEALGTSFKAIAAKGGKPAEQLEAALKKANLSSGMDAEALRDGLGKLSEDQALVLRSNLNDVEGVSGLGTKTAHAQYVARSGAGKGGEGGAVNSLQNAGQFLGLAMKMQGAHAIGGGALDMDKVGSEEVVKRIAAEQVGGKMTEQDMDMMRDAIGSLKSKQGAEGKNASNVVNMENIATELGLMQKTADEESKKVEDEKKLKENAWKDDQKLAQQVVDNTFSMSDKLDNMMEGYLASISKGVMEIVAWLPGGSRQKDTDKESRAGAVDSANKNIEDLTKQLRDVQGQGEEQDKTRAGLRAKIDEEKEIRRRVSQDTHTRGSSEDFRSQARGMMMRDKITGETEQAKKDYLAKMSPGQLETMKTAGERARDRVFQEEDALSRSSPEGIKAGNEAFAKAQDEILSKLVSIQQKEERANKTFQRDKGKVFAGMPADALESMEEEMIAAQDAVETPTEKKKAAEAVEKKYFDKFKRVDDDRTEDQTKSLLDGWKKQSKDELANQIAAGMGGDRAQNLAAAHAAINGVKPEGVDSGKYKEAKDRFASGGGPIARDGRLILDRGDGNPRMHRIDSSDAVIDIGKPGGPLSRGGGGGGNISVSVNQWGDVPGAILKALETMRVRTA